MMIENFSTDNVSKTKKKKMLDSKNEMHKKPFIKTTLCDTPNNCLLADKKKNTVFLSNEFGWDRTIKKMEQNP